LIDAQQTSRFDRLCILLLSLEWIVFGAMHFSHHDATVDMLPDLIPTALQSMVVYVTGVIEVAIGIFILVSRTRRWAALVSLVLLALYIPAVYKILTVDSALGSLTDTFRTLLRLVVVPNNIALAVFSIHLWRQGGKSSLEAA